MGHIPKPGYPELQHKREEKTMHNKSCTGTVEVRYTGAQTFFKTLLKSV